MIKDIFISVLIWINNNKKKFFGGLIGFILSVLILTIGFFKTLFIVLCTLAGYVLGSQSYTKKSLLELLERILPPGRR
ncbi:MAG: DUF2273 domain-containing protein [Tissierellia bacterium]|jgi:uncharacterized membrane protein|nr:DUF2273 domain-containing protein [Tissierellia bacterium]